MIERGREREREIKRGAAETTIFGRDDYLKELQGKSCIPSSFFQRNRRLEREKREREDETRN